MGLPEPPSLSLITPSCSVALPRPHPSSIPWNTPVSAEGSWPGNAASSGSGPNNNSHAPRDTPPGLAVSWTQPQTSASPSPASSGPGNGQHPGGNNIGQPPNPSVAHAVGMSTSTPQNSGTVLHNPEAETVQQSGQTMLAIRSGIPL